jgi:demethylmenaquinone methyltransferase/2-methoxy-6-polyprenyl-1,4-benzoquinol methylase
MAYNFDTIARTYDQLNRVMTFGLDHCWRRRAVRGLQGDVLDVACGTGDMVLELKKRGCTVTGIDLSEEMISIAKTKASATYIVGDAEHLPFPDATFDAVTCAFGVRNFVHLEQGLGEMLRVLKPGGKMVILELATPDRKVVRPFYNLYTRRIIPLLGKRIAGNEEAYTYLPQSIEHFPKGEAFLDIIQHLPFGIHRCEQRKKTFGVCRLYSVEKQKGRPE